MDRPADPRQAALDVLTSAQEGISVKSLIDFRGLSEVSATAKATATSAVCMVAGIDEAMEADTEGLPPRSWEAARAVLAKPGHFINSLRRFPYAVDGGRLPKQNVDRARQVMAGVKEEQVLAEGIVVQQLFRWVVAAWEYTQQVPEAFSTGRPSLQAPAPAAAGRAPAAAPSEASAQPGGSHVPSESTRTTLPVGSAGRSSVGRSSISSASSPVGSGATRRSDGRPSVRSPGGPRIVQEALQRSQDRLVRAGVAPERSVRSTGPRTPVSTTSPRSTNTRVSGGAKGRPSLEQQKMKLEQLMRETRELKAQESSAKWSMRREEERRRVEEKKKDERQVIKARQEFQAAMDEEAAQVAREQREVDLVESKEYQEHKRFLKTIHKEVEQQLVHEDYEAAKADSEYRVAVAKIEADEWEKPIIEANIEKYQALAEYEEIEKEREKIDRQAERDAAEQAKMAVLLAQARKEKEKAVSNLQFAQQRQQRGIASGKHLASAVN